MPACHVNKPMIRATIDLALWDEQLVFRDPVDGDPTVLLI